MFYVGQKVARKDGTVCDPPDVPAGVPATVARVFVCNGCEAIDLVEYPSSRFGYWAWGFRPAVERKTSIEIFTRMLNPKERETVT